MANRVRSNVTHTLTNVPYSESESGNRWWWPGVVRGSFLSCLLASDSSSSSPHWCGAGGEAESRCVQEMNLNDIKSRPIISQCLCFAQLGLQIPPKPQQRDQLRRFLTSFRGFFHHVKAEFMTFCWGYASPFSHLYCLVFTVTVYFHFVFLYM